MTGGRVKPRKAAAAAVIAVLLAVTVWANISGIRRDAERAALRGDDTAEWFAGDFAMETLGGGTFTRADLNRSRITVINGWGLYCAPCLRELPELEALNAAYDPEELRVVTVLADYTDLEYDADMLDEVREIIAEKGITMPVLLGNEDFTLHIFPMLHDALPGTWIVDDRGHLVEFVANARSKEEWKEIFDRCLAVY